MLFEIIILLYPPIKISMLFRNFFIKFLWSESI